MDSIRSKGWGIAAGIAVHLLFAVTVWALFWFLKGSRHGGMHGSLLMDACLALMFCVPHSLLLHPVVRRRLTQVIPGAFYGLFFTAVTCVSLLVLFALWQTVGPVLWEAKGGFRVLVDAGFYLSWAALFYSLYLTGLGYQTGLTPWLAWVRGQAPPRRDFNPCGAYRFVRHPVYLSFMGLVWFTPTMTLDQAVLTGVWTVYLFVGSWLKDRRLEHFIGEPYREYERRVPGYPLMLVGPLATKRT